MIAEIRAVCPKGVSGNDLFEFKIKKQILLPVISMKDDEGKQLFLKDSMVIGKPVMASIRDGKSGKTKQLEGILVEEKDGDVYVIPKEYVNEDEIKPIESAIKNAADLFKEAGSTIEEVSQPVIKEVEKIDTEKTLGFTKKQLLVMALTVLVIVKIFK